MSSGKNKFDISVIIPNYNGEAFLKEAIESALNQEDVVVEVIVIDDGSSDGSKSILEAYGDRIKVFFQENKGAPAARNLGLKHANAGCIKFLDADDVLLPEILQKQLQLIKELAKNEIPYGQAQWVDERLQPVKGYPVRPRKLDEDSVFHILSQNPLTSAPLHKKKLLQDIGGFDETLVKGQEFDLHLRMVLNGVSLRYFDHDVYYFRQHASISRFSNHPLSAKSDALYDMLLKQQRYIASHYKGVAPEAVTTELAKRSWAFGRALLTEGNAKKANLFFKNAMTLSNKPMDDRIIFKVMSIFFGKVGAEKIMFFIKKIISK